MPYPFTPRKHTHNLQVAEVIDAIAQADPDLFINETATLMPVKVSARLEHIDTDNPNYAPLRDATAPVICDSELGDTIAIAETHTLRLTLMAWARLHADEMARYWRELLDDINANSPPTVMADGLRNT